MTWHALIFEVKSIQPWIYGSGKLRAIVGGSQLVSGLTGSLLSAALAELDDNGKPIHFARRAGGAFIAFSERAELLHQLRQAWPVLVDAWAPGLSWVMGHGSGETIIKAGDAARRNSQGRGALPLPQLPAATPVMERSRRTGRVAVARLDQEPVDVIVQTQLDAEAQFRQAGSSRQGADDHDDVAVRLARKLGLGPEAWPRDMEPRSDQRAESFPFSLDDQSRPISRYVAMVHADGNGLGQVLREVEAVVGDGHQAIDDFRSFSEALEKATFEACVTACRKVLVPHLSEQNGTLPARPILLGGDDLSFIVRADLALHFTCAFLEAFEAETRERLAQIPGLEKQNGLTACAGLAYLRSNQPFHMGMTLAEQLCDDAKKQVRQAMEGERMFSALCQHRCTDSLITDWDAVLENQLTLPDLDRDGKEFRLTTGAWALKSREDGSLPAIETLLDLLAYFQRPGMARGPARRLMGLVGLDPSLVGEKYARWCEMLKEKARAKGKGESESEKELKQFKELLALGFGAEDWLHPTAPYINWTTHWATPIPEVLALKAMHVQARLVDRSQEPQQEAST